MTAYNSHVKQQPRIDTIALFGSQKLVRDGDSPAWFFTSATTKPERLTEREAMFVNAALHAAEVQ